MTGICPPPVVPPVVITRPLAQGRPLAARIEAAGRRAVLFPLLEIQPVSDRALLERTLAQSGQYAMIAFVSPNAIDAAFSVRPTWPPGTAFAIVGEGSRRALRRHGMTEDLFTIISPANPVRTDSETLLEVLDLDWLRGRKVLIVRGETGRELLADALRRAGVVVETVAAYRRVAPLLDDGCRRQLGDLLAAPHDWVVTSSEALRNLLDMARGAVTDGDVKIKAHRLIVPHVRIAETARTLGFDHVTLTGSGDDQLLAALQSRL